MNFENDPKRPASTPTTGAAKRNIVRLSMLAGLVAVAIVAAAWAGNIGPFSRLDASGDLAYRCPMCSGDDAHAKHGDAAKKDELYVCPMHPEVTSPTPGKCPKCKMDLVKKDNAETPPAADVYVCPMHPEVTSATPGKCPKCKMDLVKKTPPAKSGSMMETGQRQS